jgi:hypothetical protein
MNPSLLRALEFDRVVEALASFALTPVGKARMRAEAPHTDGATVAQALAATRQTVRYVEQYGVFPLRAGAGLEQALQAGRGRRPPSANCIAGLRGVVGDTGQARAPAGPDLRRWSRASPRSPKKCPPCAAIDVNGDVLDDQPRLASIRNACAASAQLRTTLGSS